jgi:hypothetical protein
MENRFSVYCRKKLMNWKRNEQILLEQSLFVYHRPNKKIVFTREFFLVGNSQVDIVVY